VSTATIQSIVKAVDGAAVLLRSLAREEIQPGEAHIWRRIGTHSVFRQP